MEKPVLRNMSYYIRDEVEQYLNAKYDNVLQKELQEPWDNWLFEHSNNGAISSVDIAYYLEEDDQMFFDEKYVTGEQKKQLILLLQKEFGDHINFYIFW